MSNISKPHFLASLATLAVAFAIGGNLAAQEQAEKNQSDQAEQSQSDQSQQQQSDEQNASQSDQQSLQDQQRQQQEQKEERQRQQREQQQQQQEDQRQQQSQQRDQQSQDRDQSSRRDADASRDREWPQPNGQDYGSDSLRFPGNQQYSRDGQRSERSQQGGLGVGLRSDGREGVVVSHVHPGSPAEEMGIRQSDRITAVNGREIQSVQQFIARIRNMDPGQQIELDIRRARGGDEQTVRGELETRQEALAEHAYEDQWGQQGGRQSYQYGPQDRGEWQTSYDERRSYSSDRTGPMSGERLEQIERQVDRLSRELDNLRVALQSIRRQSGQSSERTARYDEYQGTRRDSQDRLDGRETYRESDRDRDSGFRRDGSESRDGSDRGESRDRFNEGSGGEIGSDRQSVGSEDIQDRN